MQFTMCTLCGHVWKAACNPECQNSVFYEFILYSGSYKIFNLISSELQP